MASGYAPLQWTCHSTSWVIITPGLLHWRILSIYTQFVAVVSGVHTEGALSHCKHVTGDAVVFMILHSLAHLSSVPVLYISAVCDALEQQGPFAVGGLGVC